MMPPNLPPQALAAAMSGGGAPQNAPVPMSPQAGPGAPPPGGFPQPPGGNAGMPPEQAQQMLSSLGITPDKLPTILMAIASLVGGMGGQPSDLPPPPPPVV